MGSSLPSSVQYVANCRCCESEDDVPLYEVGAQHASSLPEEEVLERHVSWPLELNRNASNISRAVSGMSKKSNMSKRSTETAGPGQVVRMTFDMKQREYVYDEEQLCKLASVQPDGCIVVTGLIIPLSVTIDGHPGVHPGDTIQQVIGSTNDVSVGALRRLEQALLAGGRLTLLVATRPAFFDADLHCEGENWWKLGVLVMIDRQYADRVKVQSILDEGLVPDWNEENPTCQVMPGDWIVHVDEEQGTAREITIRIQDCRRGEELMLGIQTRPRVASQAVGSIDLKHNPKRGLKQPDVVRVQTADWKSMKATLTNTSAVGGPEARQEARY